MPERDWFDTMLESITNKAAALDPKFKYTTDTTLAYLKEHKSSLIGMGLQGFKNFMNYLASSDNQEAKDLYIRSKLTPAMLIELVKKNNKVMRQYYQIQKESEAEFWMLIQTLGTIGLRLLATLVLG